MPFSNYEFFLKYFGLQKLMERRKVSDALFGYKVLNSVINCSELLGLFGLHVPGRSVRSKWSLDVKLKRSNYTKNGIIHRISSTINDCCSVIDIFATSAKKLKLDLTRSL